MKQNPDLNKINKAQNHLQDIQSYKATGSLIRSREKLITGQEKPHNFFFDQEKQNQKHKTIKQLEKFKTTKLKLSQMTSKY